MAIFRTFPNKADAKRATSTDPSSQSASRIDHLKQSGSSKRGTSVPLSSKRDSELELARQKVKILSSFPRALSPTLPLSPPPSRSPSPTTFTYPRPTLKQAIPSPPSESENDEEAAKRADRKKRSALAREKEDRLEADRLVMLKQRKALVKQWDPATYKDLAHTYRNFARSLKHKADARSRQHPPTSLPTFTSIQTLVELTDSILLWVYAFWADDQATPGRVNLEVWKSLDGMKKVVRGGWEGVVKESLSETKRGKRGREEAAKGMLGLVYLIDALVLLHITTYEQTILHNRTQRLYSSTTSRSTPLSHPSSSKLSNPSSHSHFPADSPCSLTSSTSSPSPASIIGGPNSGELGLPPDYLPQVLGLTAGLSRGMRLYSTYQVNLTFGVLERRFPRTWDTAMKSASSVSSSSLNKRRNRRKRLRALAEGSSEDDLSSSAEEELDGEGGEFDLLGSGSGLSERVTDPSAPELGFGWPIGIFSPPPGTPGLPAGVDTPGPGGMLPHLVVFGRHLTREWVDRWMMDGDSLEGAKGKESARYDLKQGWEGA